MVYVQHFCKHLGDTSTSIVSVCFRLFPMLFSIQLYLTLLYSFTYLAVHAPSEAIASARYS